MAGLILASGQHCSDETSQRWRAVGDAVSYFTGLIIKPKTSHANRHVKLSLPLDNVLDLMFFLELSDKNKEKEEFTASKKKFDDTMAKVWRVFDQIKEEKTEQKRKADLRKARKKEWQALKRLVRLSVYLSLIPPRLNRCTRQKAR